MLWSHHPRAKEAPAAAGSIFSCIIYGNTCLKILDRAQSERGGVLEHLNVTSLYLCCGI